MKIETNLNETSLEALSPTDVFTSPDLDGPFMVVCGIEKDSAGAITKRRIVSLETGEVFMHDAKVKCEKRQATLKIS